jgi:hypothetical protein
MMSYMICVPPGIPHILVLRRRLSSSTTPFVKHCPDLNLKLYGLAPIADSSDEIIEILLAALRWDMQQRRFGLTAVGLDKLHALSVELLDVLKDDMPYRTGGPEAWNFEKAHSILHKVSDILLFGWCENFSHQGPEHELYNPFFFSREFALFFRTLNPKP